MHMVTECWRNTAKTNLRLFSTGGKQAIVLEWQRSVLHHWQSRAQSVRREEKARKGSEDLGNWLGEVSACQDK